jgi:uncharacterized protein (DUF2252 family)
MDFTAEQRKSVAQRIAVGREARVRAPRSSHASAGVDAAPRPDPIGLLEEQAASRLPELVPIRYARMASSPFAFFRGAALIMASDLANTPTSGLDVQLCGDAHVSNFGLFASPERQLVFDINDFDETLPGPWEWDVKRLAASLQIAAQGSGFTEAQSRAIVLASASAYRRAMTEFAGQSTLQVWYAHLPAEVRFADIRDNLDSATAKLAARTMSKAKTRDHLQAYAKLVQADGDQLSFISDPPLLVRLEELLDGPAAAMVQERLSNAFGSYRETLSADRRTLLDQFRPVDLARKVVGVGSVGTRAWVLLMIGRATDDPLLLQIKEAQASVLERFLPPSEYDNAGHRVVAGQRTMQASSDILLGWNRLAGLDDVPRDFYVRQLRDWKGTVEVEQMTPGAMLRYAEVCAWTLARAHARSGDRIAIASYLGSGDAFDRALAQFAGAYAEQNHRDYEALLGAIGSGRIAAQK